VPDARKAFLLRIDPGLWNELESWASGELRSVNNQIEFILREAARRRKFGAVSAEPKEPPRPTHEFLRPV